MSLATVLVAAAMLAATDGPFVYEVPRGGASLADQRSAPTFVAAPFRVERGRVVRGAWRPSDEILGRGTRDVVVVASWCPACRQLLARLAQDRAARAPIILFLEEEYALRERGARTHAAARRGAAPADPILWDAPALEGFPRELWLLRSGSPLARRITHYPFHLVCTRDGCRPAQDGPR